MPLLEVHHLTTAIPTPRGAIRPVDDVSLTLEHGEMLGVVGESGSGKSMLIRSIMGLLPRAAACTGEVLFDGTDLRSLSRAELSRIWGADISMVFQDPLTALTPVVRVGRQIVEVIRRHRRVSEAEARVLAVSLLKQVGLPDPEQRMGAYPHQLSGGMRQRVLIAIALACGPRLVLADEPTTALDATVQANILNLLANAQEQSRMAIILVSHDLAVVKGRVDQVAVMYGGRIVECGPAASVLSTPRMPYTQALLEATPSIHKRPHTPLTIIPGRPPDLAMLDAGCSFAPRCRYASGRCRTRSPTLGPAGSAHSFACWHPLEVSSSDTSPNPLAGTTGRAGAPPQELWT